MSNENQTRELVRKAIIRRRYRLGSPLRNPVSWEEIVNDTGLTR